MRRYVQNVITSERVEKVLNVKALQIYVFWALVVVVKIDYNVNIRSRNNMD